MNEQTSMAASVRALISDVGELVRKEIELAKAEAGEKAGQIQTGLISIAVGLLVATCALLVLIQALVVALSNVMPPSIAAAVIGTLLALVAAASIKRGETYLRPDNLAPRRTIRSVREGTQRMKETMQ